MENILRIENRFFFLYFSSPDNLIGIDYKISTENGGPDFVAGFVPKDKPRCGFDGEGCPKNKGSTIAATVLGILLLVACIVYVVWNRRIKVEQEIEGLLWRINLDCLQRGDRQVCLIFTHLLGLLFGFPFFGVAYLVHLRSF